MAEVENPYGLKAMWEHGDYISKGTLFILVIMSMGTWYILVTKLWDQMKLFRQAKAVDRDFWKAESLQAGLDNLRCREVLAGHPREGTHRPVQHGQPNAGEQTLGRHMLAVAPHFRQHLRLLLIGRGKRGMAALAGQGRPPMRRLDHPANAQPGTGPDHGQHPMGTRHSGMSAQLGRLQVGQGQGQRLGIVEQAQFLQVQRPHQRLAGKAPMAVRQFDPVAIQCGGQGPG